MKSAFINFGHHYPGSPRFKPFSFSFLVCEMTMVTAQLPKVCHECHRGACQGPGTVPSVYECFLTTIFVIKSHAQAMALNKEQFKLEGSIYMLRISPGLGCGSLADSLPSVYKTVGLSLSTTKKNDFHGIKD